MQTHTLFYIWSHSDSPQPVAESLPPLPTCRSWISVKVITLTTQQRLMAPRVAASPATGAANSHRRTWTVTAYSCVSPRQEREEEEEEEERCCSLLPELLQKYRKGRMTHQLIWELHGPFPVCALVRVCVFGQEKGLTEAEIQMAVRGVAWNKLTECEFLLVDHHTFLPAEHPAQLSTFSQVIFHDTHFPWRAF